LGDRPFRSEEQELIRTAIKRKYQDVALQSADGLFAYHTGRKGAVALGYDPVLLDNLPDDALESFCGVGNPFSIGPIPEDSVILDVGCGAGFDLLVAREIVGSRGRVNGVDLTEEMVKKAVSILERFGDDRIAVQHISSEEMPYGDESFDHVISNGVINLSPFKLVLFKEIRRVLKPDGILQFADVCLAGETITDRVSSPDDWAQ
jgi:SAM-dependent methyltransferase